ncbi:MAG: hypothetical protein AAF438_14660 [Pseudomonadota bacterium]
MLHKESATAVRPQRTLVLAAGSQVLLLERFATDQNGNIVDVTFTQYHPERFSLVTNHQLDAA